MRAEDQVPVSSRYLMLAARLSPDRFLKEKALALEWCSHNRERLSSSDQIALEDLRTFTLHANARAFILYSCYADIPSGRTYSAVFNLADVSVGSNTIAKLRFAIFWRKLPMLTLGHGHHHLAVFEFSSDVPEIIDTLQVDLFDGGLSPPRLGMCDASTWHQICEHVQVAHNASD